MVLKLRATVAERFRSVFTDQLAVVGFDRDYQLTHEGEMLEALIDAFFDAELP